MTIIIGEMKGFMIDLYGHAFMVFNSQMQIQMQNAWNSNIVALHMPYMLEKYKYNMFVYRL